MVACVIIHDIIETEANQTQESLADADLDQVIR